MIIYLYCRLPDSSHAAAWRDVPGDTTGRRIVSCFVLLRMGFTQPPHVTAGAVVSYTAIPPLPQTSLRRFLFCCTGLGVTSTGRYPASCPMKPGLSSPAVFRHLQPRSPVLQLPNIHSFSPNCKKNKCRRWGTEYLLLEMKKRRSLTFPFHFYNAEDGI